MTVRRVEVGDEVLVVLPRTDTGHKLQLAEHLRTVEVRENDAQILRQDSDSRFWHPNMVRAVVTHDEAGIRRDGDGLYVEELPDELHQVARDGAPVSPLVATEDAAMRWLQRHQAQSADWALKYEGYSVTTVRKGDAQWPTQ